MQAVTPGRGNALPLVGRDQALLDLDAALEQARTSRGGLVLITGDPGIGKTRLAGEAVERAGDFKTVWCWCTADAASGSFRPWLQIARELAATLADAPAIDLPPSGTDADAARWQFFEAISELVRLAAAHSPLLLVLDDVHDAQESSLWLLTHLVPTLRSSPALVLATARDGERAWHAHIEARSALLRQAARIQLAPLREPHIAQLMQHQAQSPSLAHQVLTRTGGNPLLVTELVRVLSDDADAVSSALPESIRAITAARMSGLEPTCQRLLSAAAVLGARFGLDALASVAELDPSAMRSALADAESAGLVRISEPAAGCFIHELTRDAVYERIAPAERRVWHERSATALVALAERGRDVAPAEIAHHLLRAGPNAALRAANYAQQAGDRSAQLLAFEDAVSWYEQTLQALAATHHDPGRQASVHLALGEARVGCGDRTGARETFLQAAALARSASVPTVLAGAALGLGSGPAGFEVGLLDQQQLDLLEEASSALPDNEFTLRALVTARLSVATTTIESEERRLKLAHEALSLAQAANDDSAQAYALAALCDALAGPEHCQVRANYASDIIERARRLRNWPLELLGRRLRLVALLELGNRAAAEAEITAYRIRTESFSHPLYRWYVQLWRAMWALAEGRFAECRELNEQAESEGVSAGSHNALLLGITQRWCLLGEQEDRDGLYRLFGAMDLEQVGGSWARVPAALLQAQLGKPDEARQRLDALAGQLPFVPRDSEWLAYMAQIAETIGLIGSHPIASWTYDALLPFGALFVIEGIGAAIRGPVQRHLSILAAAMGKSELAEQHLATALEAARTLGAPQLAARIEREAKRPQVQHTDDNVFRHDGELWTVHFGGVHVQLRDSKGMRDLAVLLTRPGTHVAAVDLAGAGSSGDAGEILDASARDAYRRRLIELEEDAAEADAAADVARSARIAAERELLLEQLSAAYGLGGRARRSGSGAERARSAVTARLREAIKRIEVVHPQLGRHLLRSVKTGTFCVYEPEGPTRWQVHQ